MNNSIQSKVRFTIICPLYNKEKYIDETISSVVNQTYTNWELIIIDDDSTDNSLDRASKWENDKILVIRRSVYSNMKGGSVCRNIGLREAKGNYILFLDADDILSSNCLEIRHKYLIKYKEFNFFVFNISRFINDPKNIKNNIFLNYYERINYWFSPKTKEYFLQKFLKYDTQWSICNVIWTKDFLVQLGGFTEEYQRLQDPEIHTRALFDENIKFKFLKYEVQPDVFVRSDHDRSITISALDTYSRIANSIELYIKNATLCLNKLQKEDQKGLLCGYILLFEQIYAGYYSRINDQERIKFEKVKSEFYSQIDSAYSSKCKKLVCIYRSLSSNRLLKAIRLPAFYVHVCKNFLL